MHWNSHVCIWHFGTIPPFIAHAHRDCRYSTKSFRFLWNIARCIVEVGRAAVAEGERLGSEIRRFVCNWSRALAITAGLKPERRSRLETWLPIFACKQCSGRYGSDIYVSVYVELPEWHLLNPLLSPKRFLPLQRWPLLFRDVWWLSWAGWRGGWIVHFTDPIPRYLHTQLTTVHLFSTDDTPRSNKCSVIQSDSFLDTRTHAEFQ